MVLCHNQLTERLLVTPVMVKGVASMAALGTCHPCPDELSFGKPLHRSRTVWTSHGAETAVGSGGTRMRTGRHYVGTDGSGETLRLHLRGRADRWRCRAGVVGTHAHASSAAGPQRPQDAQPCRASRRTTPSGCARPYHPARPPRRHPADHRSRPADHHYPAGPFRPPARTRRLGRRRRRRWLSHRHRR